MWSHLSLFLIVGVAVSYCDHNRFVNENHEYGWSKGKEYKYMVQSTTMTSLDDPHHEATGITMKGTLIIQAMTPNTLYGTVRELQYALKEEMRPKIQPREDSQEQDETYRKVPISGKSFQISVKNGVIQEMTVERGVPMWEINIMKSFMSQLQVDASGQNIIPSKYNQLAEDVQQAFASYKVMEDSVGGNCEVVYDIAPLDGDVLKNSPEITSLSSIDGGNFIEIRKMKDFKNCNERHYYLYNQTNQRLSWPHISKSDPLDTSVSQISTTRMIISGNLRQFTTQSSVTKSTIFIKSDKKDRIIGNVYSMINLTLVDVNDKHVGQTADTTVSTGNLMYMDRNPFAESQTIPETQTLSIATGWHQIHSSDRSRLKDTFRPDFFDSDSNSDSSSSEEKASKEFIPYPPPRLTEIPYNSFMPFFIGLSGKNSSEDYINPVVLAANLMMRVTKAIEDPTVYKPDGMIETFMILQDLLRTMDNDQLAEVEERALKLSDDSMREYVQKTIYKTIVQIGTAPSLLMFTNWIKNEAFSDVDAATLVARFPRTIRTLSAEYLKHFYEMISKPETIDKDVFNVSAPVAFAELIRSAHDKMLFTRKWYPSNSRITNEDLETYISYFAEQLREAIQKNNMQQIHTYIVALSFTGHPKMLSVFEPYLEGKQAITKCQRTMMVTGLSRLARTYPSLARSVLAKIYLNTRENDEIRVAAFFSLIRTDPPLITYMRMAQFTNSDRSPQVNTAVSTTIKSLATLKHARARNIAFKARLARELLKKNPILGSLSSLAYYTDTDDEDSLLRSFYVEKMGSAKTDVNYMRIGLNMANDYLKLFNFRFGYGVSDIRQIMDVFYENYNLLFPKEEERERSLVEELVRALNIEPLPLEPFEGHFFSDSKYETQFYPFDMSSIERDISRTITNISRALSEHFSVNTIYNHDEVLGFPTETGLPFVHTIQTPIVQKFIPKEPNISVGKDFEIKVDIQMLFASRVQNRWGFTVPFELQQYHAGIDRDFRTYLPAKLKAKKQLDRDQIQLQLGLNRALLQKDQQDHSLMYFSTVPFVIRHDVLDLEPLSRNHMLQEKIQETSKRNKFQIGIFEIVMEGHGKMIETPNLSNIIRLFSSASQGGNHYKKINISVNTAVQPLQLTIAHAKSNTNSPATQLDLEKFAVTDRQPNSEARRKQFLTEVSKGLQSSHNHVWDIDVGYPRNASQKLTHQVFTIGVGHSNANKKHHTIFYWNIKPATSESVDYEIFGNGLTEASRETPLDLERSLDWEQRDTFEYILQYGKDYTDGKQVHITGNTSQSSDVKNMLKNNKIIKECLRNIKDNEESQACQKAFYLIQLKDRINFSATGSASESIIVEILVNLFSHLYSQVTKKVIPRENTKNVIDVETKMTQDRDQIDILVSSFDKDIYLTLSSHSNAPLQTLSPSTMSLELWLSEMSRLASKLSWPLPLELGQHLATGLLSSRWLEHIQSLWLPRWKLLSFEKQLDSLSKYSEKPSICHVGKRQITTFDGKTYPTYGEKNWQVLVIPSLRYEATIPEDERMSVLIREKDGRKELRLLLSSKNIDIRKTNDGIQILIDGQPVKQYNTQDKPDNTSYQIRDNDDVYVEIYELPDKSIEIKSDTYRINAIYNGETVAIRVADQYSNEIRGLCGNYDARPYNDFLSPQNCLAQNPQHFNAMYTLREDNQKEYTAINKDKQYPCVQQTHLPSNVISDIEAGRSPLDWTPYSKKASRKEIKDPQSVTPFTYHTKIQERDDELCFSTRPIPVCQGSLPTKTNVKTFEFFCLPRNEASEQLKLRIEKGANPDFSQKPVSFKKAYEVPLACRAA